MDRLKKKAAGRARRHRRVRKKVAGSAERPRLAVFRSERHIYVQLVDDDEGRTIASASSRCKEASGDGKPSEVAARVGGLLAARAKEKKIASVVFDRGGYRYHGRVKALAEAAREGGLQF